MCINCEKKCLSQALILKHLKNKEIGQVILAKYRETINQHWQYSCLIKWNLRLNVLNGTTQFLWNDAKGAVCEGLRSNLYAPNNMAAKHIKFFYAKRT